MTLMTFGMICAIRREKLGLNQSEAMKRVGISNLCHIEKGKKIAGRNVSHKLIEFYKITPEELAQCRDLPHEHLLPAVEIKAVNRITEILRLIEELLDEVREISLPGYIGEAVKASSLDQLSVAKKAINDLCILDKLL